MDTVSTRPLGRGDDVVVSVVAIDAVDDDYCEFW